MTGEGVTYGPWAAIGSVPTGIEVLVRGGMSLMGRRPLGRRVAVVDDRADLYREDGTLRTSSPTHWAELPPEPADDAVGAATETFPPVPGNGGRQVSGRRRPAEARVTFEAWLEILRTDVVRCGFGYAPGEFEVFPDLWRGAYDEGLSPIDAFIRSLRVADEARDARDEERRRRRREIDSADARYADPVA